MKKKSVNVDLIEFCHSADMFCQCRNKTGKMGILIEDKPGFFLKALADRVAEGHCCSFRKLNCRYYTS